MAKKAPVNYFGRTVPSVPFALRAQRPALESSREHPDLKKHKIICKNCEKKRAVNRSRDTKQGKTKAGRPIKTQNNLIFISRRTFYGFGNANNLPFYSLLLFFNSAETIYHLQLRYLSICPLRGVIFLSQTSFPLYASLKPKFLSATLYSC